MNKNLTYNINETLLQQRFSEYEVPFDEKNWDDLEKNLNEVKIQKQISFGKVNLKLVLIPVIIGLAAVLVYANYDKTDSIENKSAATSIPIETPTIENNVVQAPSSESTKPAAPVSEKTTTESVQKTTDNPVVVVKTPVVSVLPATIKDTQSVTREAKKETDSVIIPNPPVVIKEKTVESSEPRTTKKKKNRRRNSANAIEDIRSTSLIPSSLDDDVVVPGN